MGVSTGAKERQKIPKKGTPLAQIKQVNIIYSDIQIHMYKDSNYANRRRDVYFFVSTMIIPSEMDLETIPD